MGFDFMVFFAVLAILGGACVVLIAAFAAALWVHEHTDNPVYIAGAFAGTVCLLSAIIAAIKI